MDAVDGKYSSRDAIDEKARSFYGKQGPWYTVGYKVDVTIERELGRPTLISVLCDKRQYLRTYNEAAAKANSGLPLWPAKLAEFRQ